MAISLLDLAFGDLRKNAEGRYEARLIGHANLAAMPVEPRDYLVRHLADLIARSEEYGQAQAGWWSEQSPPAEIGRLLLTRGNEFAEVTAGTLGRLTTATPGTASAGLIAVVRFDDGREFAAILKLDVAEEDIYRFASQAAAEGTIEYRHFDNVLPPAAGQLKKAALLPNPSRADADVRVVDDEAQEGTATYWLNFLGVTVHPPAPRALKTALELARDVVRERVAEAVVERAVSIGLREIAQAVQPVTARRVVDRVAEECGLPTGEVWADVAAVAGNRLPAGAVITRQAVERLYTEITFRAGGQQVTVRGPTDALAGRYRWDSTATGYTLTLTTDDEPRVNIRTKPGRVSVS